MLLEQRARMIEDRFQTPYWQEIASNAGMSQFEIEKTVKRYWEEANDESFIDEYQRLEKRVAALTPGKYPEEGIFYNKAYHTVSQIWGGGALLEKPFVLTPRERIQQYPPVRAVNAASGIIFQRKITN